MNNASKKIFNLEDALLAEKAKAIVAMGFFDDINDFIKESVNTFLAARKDVRMAVACELYKEGKISIGKASEVADLNIEEIKKELNKRGVKRKLVSLSEEKIMTKNLLKIRENLCS